MTTTQTATAPTGATVTRTSKRDAEFAVLVDEATDLHATGATGWAAWSWVGRRDLADKAATKARECYGTVAIVPVTTH